MPTKPTRVAVYLRVSRDDGSQETDYQHLQLRDSCGWWEGHELVAEYVDRESGTRGRRQALLRRAALLGRGPLQPGGDKEDPSARTYALGDEVSNVRQARCFSTPSS